MPEGAALGRAPELESVVANMEIKLVRIEKKAEVKYEVSPQLQID